MAKSLHDKINIRGEVDQWSRYTIERFQKSIRQKKIGKSGALERSFGRKMQSSGGELHEVSISFLMRGRFRDMGVGRGLKAYERNSNKASQLGAKVGANVSYVHRAPKRWLNKTKMSQVYKLNEILGKSTGKSVGTLVSDGMSSTSITTNI
ncbi:hypothetical protein ACFSJU_14700 [Paradesertivirga mongoliensis]|uniref:Uncharacterized protein n=1 Tax=Paradesertivirga mongoliensis TaxID=2100740 RepID=A0ABW4ZPF0_9SPHI|nr:hypothetical protein [Pedobacter mongoliensis]